MEVIDGFHVGFGQMNLVVHIIVFFQQARKVRVTHFESVNFVGLTWEFLGKGVGRV